MPNIINYFIDSISSSGYVDFYDDNFSSKNILKIKKCPESAINKLVNEMIDVAKSKNLNVEVIHSCLNNNIIGMIIPSKKSGLINIPPYCNNEVYKYEITDNKKLLKMMLFIDRAYDDLKKAKEIHDEWEKVYISNMDYDKINELTKNTIKILFGDDEQNQKKGENKVRFLGAATIYGPVDYIKNITENTKKRYFIKGRPGTGKSTFLKEIVKIANEKGFDTQTYYCALDTNSVDMIVINGLDICIFDSTYPHEYFPEKESDDVIDIYKVAVKEGTDENNTEKLEEITKRYKKQIKSANKNLNKANKKYIKSQKLYEDNFTDEDYKKLKEQAIETLF